MSEYSPSPLWKSIHARICRSADAILETTKNQPPIGETPSTVEKGEPAKPQPRYELQNKPQIKRTTPVAVNPVGNKAPGHR